MEHYATRILELLNYPNIMKCPELGILIDRASIKELNDVYPAIVNSIFGIRGGPGWEFHTITRKTHPGDFDLLYNFFMPLGGPMFRLIYKLLNDPMKYELPVSLLPVKMQQMLEGGRYASFYTDLINIDPFRRQISSLVLNAFDYFMFHFALYGFFLNSPQCFYEFASTEKHKSLYFMLTAEYLCAFLPSNPYNMVLPLLNCATVKTPTASPLPVIQPAKSPKFLKLSAISHHQNTTHPTRAIESPSSICWRTESVLHIFIDTWLRLDVEDMRELPGSEFVRCARILIKQLHAFGNSVDLDNSSMSVLRESAQPLMSNRMYAFLKSIISRWPLDSSFSDVLEMWLSFIQPWRYFYDRDPSHLSDIPITTKYEAFIADNLIIYTQIFVQLVPRFERTDLTTLKNTLMLFRLLKVFNQTNLVEILRRIEAQMPANTNITMLQHSFNASKHSHNSSLNVSGGEWKSFNTSGNRSGNEIMDDSYINLFGEIFQSNIEDLAKKVYLSKIIARQNLETLLVEKGKKYQGIWKYLHKYFKYDEDPIFEANLNDKQKIPDILDFNLQVLASSFGVVVNETEISPAEVASQEDSRLEESYLNATFRSDLSDQSLNLSPHAMRAQSKLITYTGDPALIPIMSNEFTFLVRFLHQLSCKLNLMFGNEMVDMWNRRDIWGRMCRQILSSPIRTQTFDKSQGYSMLKTEDLPPRLCLRSLASHKSAFIITTSFVLGYILFNAPSYGFILLAFVSFIFIFIRSLFSDVMMNS